MSLIATDSLGVETRRLSRDHCRAFPIRWEDPDMFHRKVFASLHGRQKVWVPAFPQIRLDNRSKASRNERAYISHLFPGSHLPDLGLELLQLLLLYSNMVLGVF